MELQVYCWGGLLRGCQALLEGAPTLLVGVIVAGAIRYLLGPENTRRLFGNNSWRSLPLAWLIGMLMPVCSLGVIPVANELRRARVAGGAVLAFALTAPLFNPLSLLYGLTLAEPMVIVVFAFCSLLLVTVIGVVWDWIHPSDAMADEQPPRVEPGIRRMLAILFAAVRTTGAPLFAYCIVGILGTVSLSILFSKGSLGNEFAHGDPRSPLLMLAISPLAYATPLTVMMQIGSMFVHGNSVGAAYILLTMGTGVNLGLIVWCWMTYGLRNTVVFMTLFAVLVTGIAFAIEEPLHSAGHVDHPHTHAFDGYSSPFYSHDKNLPFRFRQELSQSSQSYEQIALGLLASLFIAHLAIRAFRMEEPIERWLCQSHASSVASRRLDFAIPAPALAAIGGIGLVVLSIVSCYVYYPSPQETLDDMRVVRADALSAAASGDKEEAARQIDFYDDLTRRLQVGYYLRNGKLDDFQRAKASVLRGRLEQLKDALEADQRERVPTLINQVSNAHQRLRRAILEDRPT